MPIELVKTQKFDVNAKMDMASLFASKAVTNTLKEKEDEIDQGMKVTVEHLKSENKLKHF